MSTIFIAHADDDRELARSLTSILEGYGYAVWWGGKLPPGALMPDAIKVPLEMAQCVVVLWSQAASGSRWVRLEARKGAEKGILIPALVEREVDLPMEFEDCVTLDLVNDNGAVGYDGLKRLVDWVVQRLRDGGQADGVRRKGPYDPPQALAGKTAKDRPGMRLVKASKDLPRWRSLASF